MISFVLLGRLGPVANSLSAAESPAGSIQTLFANRCLACHGPDQAAGGLRLDGTLDLSQPLPGGDAPVVAGQPEASLLWQRVTSEDPEYRMPPDQAPLTKDERAVVRAWIQQGAPWETHWAFQPIVKRKPPEGRAAAVAAEAIHPIDAWVGEALQRFGWTPSPPADRAVLLKRLCYDLWGLPPTADQRAAFLHDKRPDAYERCVDTLLASPLFGERWGRHWLDFARYADSDGYEKDRPRPTAWLYRDWVIAAINADLPFDEFTRQQLAGDLVPDSPPATRLATAFHRQTLTNTEGGVDQEEYRVAAIFDRVDTTATVWLGLTVGCARCHDHKYDAIPQRDYYHLFALFNNADETDEEMTTPSPLDVGKSSAATKVKVSWLRERRNERRETHIFQRGDFQQPAERVEPNTLGIVSVPVSVQDRLQFVDWLTDRRNPLTARVAANHIWSHLFGRGLVATPDDFGVRGERPTHPALLDWLAQELLDRHWSRKELIRTIVLSHTYRQSSHVRPEIAAIDPYNRWLSRQNRFRVEAEAVRDIYLALADLLVLRMGGPSVYPAMDPSITQLSYADNFQWKTSSGGDAYRRGMYTFFKRTAPHPLLTTFDCPDANTTRIRREISNSPLQPLATLNDPTFVEASRHLARLVVARCDTDLGNIDWLYQRCTQELPVAAARTALLDLLQQARKEYRARPELVTTLTGTENVDQAAWTLVARCLFNLEPTLVRE